MTVFVTFWMLANVCLLICLSGIRMPLVKFCVSLSPAMSLHFDIPWLDEHLALGSMLPSPPWEGRMDGFKRSVVRLRSVPVRLRHSDHLIQVLSISESLEASHEVREIEPSNSRSPTDCSIPCITRWTTTGKQKIGKTDWNQSTQDLSTSRTFYQR